MKMVVLDGYTLNPGDLDWEGLRSLGECRIYDRTSLTDEEEKKALEEKNDGKFDY